MVDQYKHVKTSYNHLYNRMEKKGGGADLSASSNFYQLSSRPWEILLPNLSLTFLKMEILD